MQATEIRLTSKEQNQLKRCEIVIKQGLKTFVEVGQALMTIRDSRLYRGNYNDFESYCNDEWQLGRHYVNRMIGASKVVSNLEMVPIGTKPQSESQARPLTKLEPELQRQAWQEITTENDPNEITAKVVAEKVETLTDLNKSVKQVKAENEPNTIFMPVPLTEKEILAKAKEIKAKGKQEKTEILAIRKAKVIENLKAEIKTKPTIHCQHYDGFLKTIKDKSIDLLITDPPYSTDIKDIDAFAKDWVTKALPKLKENGRAYICTGAYPNEIKAYSNALASQDIFIVDAPLIWTYRNTLGVTPKTKYNLNYQIIWHLYSESSRPLDNSITNEMFSVQDINAPDGRLGNRFHTWQKPNELAERLIRHSTVEGDIILDCFACTGTFSLMAAKLNRKSTACDVSESNLLIAEKRGCNVEF